MKSRTSLEECSTQRRKSGVSPSISYTRVETASSSASIIFDKKNGVLVMSYYHRMTPERGVELLGKIVQKLVSKIARVQMADIHADNVRNAAGRLIFVDCGY